MDFPVRHYLGPEFSISEIKKSLKKYKATYVEYNHFENLCDDVSNYLAKGFVVWMVPGLNGVWPPSPREQEYTGRST